jgi:hypothetical protein
MRSPPTSSILALRSTLLLAGLFVACGRTVLDDPIDVTGAAGATPGTAGAGTAGVAGTAGFSGTAGFATGTAGFAGTAGFFGGTAGAAGFSGTAGMAGFFGGTAGVSGTAGAAGCTNGDEECFSTTDVGICQGGQWVDAFTCPRGCVNGVCAECVPGMTQCDSMTTEQICTTNGIWGASVMCGGTGVCTNGSCPDVECVGTATRCASNETVQTCVNGAWADTTDCEYVCDSGGCVVDPKTVFVTSKVFQGGSFGGLAGADQACQNLAQMAGLAGTYLAWLSDSTGSPATRFSQTGGPYQLVDGTEIAHNWIELTSGMLFNGISATELGTMPPASSNPVCGGQVVWSDTSSDGTLKDAALSCDDWSNTVGESAAFGVAGLASSWTDACVANDGDPAHACSGVAALYCFEQ